MGLELMFAVSHADLKRVVELRGDRCPQCRELTCDAVPCERCSRHGFHLVAMREGESAVLCHRCVEERSCDSCGVKLPRWKLASVESDSFCEKCVGYAPEEAW